MVKDTTLSLTLRRCRKQLFLFLEFLEFVFSNLVQLLYEATLPATKRLFSRCVSSSCMFRMQHNYQPLNGTQEAYPAHSDCEGCQGQQGESVFHAWWDAVGC